MTSWTIIMTIFSKALQSNMLSTCGPFLIQKIYQPFSKNQGLQIQKRKIRNKST